MMHRSLAALSIAMAAMGSQAETLKGEQAYKQNCQACHRLDTFTTGPSLVYMRKHYPADHKAAFIEWTKNPGKKNPDTIQMPPMGHLGEQTLADIHDYVLVVAQHVKEQQAKPQFEPFKQPARSYPYVQRKYLPFTSPASIQVALSDAVSVAWDTTIGQMRYVFPTHKGFNGESNRQQDAASILVRQDTELWKATSGDSRIHFEGYEVHPDGPIFYYRVGQLRVQEQIGLGQHGTSIVSRYRLEGNEQSIKLSLHQFDRQFADSKGEPAKPEMKFTQHQANEFTLEVVLP